MSTSNEISIIAPIIYRSNKIGPSVKGVVVKVSRLKKYISVRSGDFVEIPCQFWMFKVRIIITIPFQKLFLDISSHFIVNIDLNYVLMNSSSQEMIFQVQEFQLFFTREIRTENLSENTISLMLFKFFRFLFDFTTATLKVVTHPG